MAGIVPASGAGDYLAQLRLIDTQGRRDQRRAVWERLARVRTLSLLLRGSSVPRIGTLPARRCVHWPLSNRC